MTSNFIVDLNKKKHVLNSNFSLGTCIGLRNTSLSWWSWRFARFVFNAVAYRTTEMCGPPDSLLSVIGDVINGR